MSVGPARWSSRDRAAVKQDDLHRVFLFRTASSRLVARRNRSDGTDDWFSFQRLASLALSPSPN